MPRARTDRVRLVCVGIFAATLAGIWWPEFAHYWVPTPRYSAALIESLRTSPADATLEKLSRITLEPGKPALATELPVVKADRVLAGVWVDDFGERDLHLPFDKADLVAGWGTQQLRFASLRYLDPLLTAYELTGDRRYLATARDVINAWAAYERGALLPRGLVWNDHAIAARVFALTRYWRLFRQSPLFDVESGRLAMEFIGRSGRMLADPRHFTVRTNHGVIQNVALLHIAASFPALPDAAMFRRVAIERLQAQLGFYQSDEGVVLEHSAGYHAAGMILLQALLNYRDLIGPDLASVVDGRLNRACRFLSDLARPDGSLPLVGDTPAQPTTVRCDSTQQPEIQSSAGAARLALYPASGYAITWLGNPGDARLDVEPSQTVAAWGNFASHAHKHADDASIVTWLAGRPILSGTGYWPYGHSLQDAAHSWRGANAPHFEWEGDGDPRHSQLLSAGASRRMTAIDLLRTTSRKDAWIRRQVITIGPAQWVVVDLAEPRSSGTVSTVWTFFPDWVVAENPLEAVYRLHDSVSGRSLWASVASNDKLRITDLRASAHPFGGFVALGMTPSQIRPAVSLEVAAAAGRPVATVLSAAADVVKREAPVLRWAGLSNWSLCLDGEACRSRLQREGARLVFSEQGAVETLDMAPVPSQSAATRRIDDNYRAAAARYPTWTDYYSYRTKATLLLAVAFILQETAFLALGLIGATRYSWIASVQPALRWLAVLAWVLVGWWAVFRYFAEPI